MTFLSAYPNFGSGSLEVNGKFKQVLTGKDSKKELYTTLVRGLQFSECRTNQSNNDANNAGESGI